MATNVNNETGLIGITPKYKFHDQVTIDTGDTIQDVTWLDCEYLAKFKKNSLGPMIVRPDYIYEDTSGNLARNGVTIVGVTTENTLARVTDPEVLRILLANISHTLDNQIRLSEVASGSIGAAWFAGNTKIEVFDCPRGYSVAASAFNGCTGLREVFIQRNVSLGNSAFNGCNRVDCYHFLDSNVGTFGTTVFAGLSGSCYLYVPNEAVVNYCKVANLGSYINRIRGHIKGWHLICADGSYKYNLRDCYDTATNISFRLEGTYVTNLALSVDPETNEATVTVTGMLPDTDENAQLYYEFDYRNHHFSGYVPLHLKTGAAEIIEFEDPEVKRICVANWGGIYRMSLDGYEGEMTKEQAAKVSSIGTTFQNNTKIGKFNEFQYFTSLVNFTGTYSANSPFSGSSLVEIDLRNVNTLCENMFGTCRSLKKLNNIKPTVRLTCTSNGGAGPFIRCSSLETKLYLANATYLAGTSVSSTISVSLFREIGSPEIWLPKSVSTISASYVFYNSSRLSTIVITRDSSVVTISNSNALGNLASGAKVYVPNDLVISYRKASYWANIYTRILPIIEGPSVIYDNGTYSFVPNTPFTGFTDMTWTLEENDYLTLTTEQDGSATITASGMTTDTDVTVRLEYSFEYDGNEVSGTINIPVDYKEVIQFEDAEVKRICVNNWGGKYGIASKVPGVPGELTYEQAAAVTGIDGKFGGNTVMTSFEEFQYFTNVISTNINGVRFASCSKLTKIIIPDMRDHTLVRWFLSNCTSLKRVKVCEGNTRINGWFVNGCSHLEYLLLPSTLNNLAVASTNTYQHFLDTPATCAYIVKCSVPPNAGVSNIFQRANGKFYVPDESVELYKTTAYWNSVAARIFPMSQLPKDKPECPWLEELSEEGILRDYIDFEDEEVKRICCTNWGDYTEVVKTETVTEEEETVSISTVYTYVHKVNTTATRTDIKTITSSRAKTEEDVVGETSTTTTYPLGMTKAQAAAVSSLGTTAFNGNTLITKFNELKYFTNATNLTNVFTACTQLKEVDLSNVTNLGTGSFQSSGIIYVYAPKARSVNQASGATGWAASTRSLIGCLWKSLSTINSGGMYNSTNKYHIFLMQTPPTVNNGLTRWTGRTYVPDIYLETYQNNTTWASQVRSLSLLETDYPDCPWLEELREEGYIE